MADAREELAAKATLWSQAIAVASIKTLVLVTLDLHGGNYSQWHGLFEIALCKYTLDDHIKPLPTLDGQQLASSSPDTQWNHLDALVLSWLYGSISPDIHTMVMEPDALAFAVWTNIVSLCHDNTETHAIYLEQEFRSFAQGSLSIVDYCCKQKALADDLAAVDNKISNKMLVLNTLRGLNPKFAHMRMLLSMKTPFPLFLETRSALLLEELTSAQESPTSSVFIATTGGGSKNNSNGVYTNGGVTYGMPNTRGSSGGSSNGGGSNGNSGYNNGCQRNRGSDCSSGKSHSQFTSNKGALP